MRVSEASTQVVMHRSVLVVLCEPPATIKQTKLGGPENIVLPACLTTFLHLCRLTHMQQQSHPHTSMRIIAEARHILQTDGYSMLRFSDIAKTLGIRGASVHYHFSKKSLLVAAVMADYRTTFIDKLATIDRETSTTMERFERYIDLYRHVLDENANHICPGGMLSAEISTLPSEIRREVTAFFEENENWLIRLFEDESMTITLPVMAPRVRARQVISLLQGGLLMARLCGDPEVFEAAASLLHSPSRFTPAQEDHPG